MTALTYEALALVIRGSCEQADRDAYLHLGDEDVEVYVDTITERVAAALHLPSALPCGCTTTPCDVHHPDATLRAYLIAEFDVTDLSDEERDGLAGEVVVQAEASELHPDVHEPRTRYESRKGLP